MAKLAQKWVKSNWLTKECDEVSTGPAPHDVLTLFYLKLQFNRTFSHITYYPHDRVEYELGNWSGVTYGNLHMFKMDKESYLITHPHLAAVRNIVNSWFSALLYSWIADSKYHMISINDMTRDYLYAGASLVASYGQDSYTVIKSTNPLCIGKIIRDMEVDPDFFNETMEGIPSHYHYTSYVRFLVTPITTHVEVMAILEVMG